MKTYPSFNDLLKKNAIKTRDLEIILRKSKNTILRIKKDPGLLNVKEIYYLAKDLKLNINELF